MSYRDKERDEEKTFNRGYGCRFCGDDAETIDYKDVALLRNFVTDRGKIVPRRVSGLCAKCQREIATAICRARMIALMPFGASNT